MTEPSGPTGASPTPPQPEADEVAAAWLTGVALTLVGALLVAVPLYSILGLAWSVVSGAVRLPLESGAVRDGVMALVIGFFGILMLRIGVRTLRRQKAAR